MVYGAQNYAYLYYERPARKAVKNAKVVATNNKVATEDKPQRVPAFAAHNVATC
ncbi:hypothetical protein L9G74_16750 [Shewanella sp. C32]|uniref:Uncharacterized protein n=1 Tax=Shewanella electrica TaxID=515560 RepID=A0ABT2FP14_9GAMM|nr:hypothetical protein [Shewanella electrica]MCH1925663.1 hypothetical protein [Shewanella electrica]MCS4558088.1 hypothetical protein [Shewanella electrica]